MKALLYQQARMAYTEALSMANFNVLQTEMNEKFLISFVFALENSIGVNYVCTLLESDAHAHQWKRKNCEATLSVRSSSVPWSFASFGLEEMNIWWTKTMSWLEWRMKRKGTKIHSQQHRQWFRLAWLGLASICCALLARNQFKSLSLSLSFRFPLHSIDSVIVCRNFINNYAHFNDEWDRFYSFSFSFCFLFWFFFLFFPLLFDFLSSFYTHFIRLIHYWHHFFISCMTRTTRGKERWIGNVLSIDACDESFCEISQLNEFIASIFFLFFLLLVELM